jgi:chorismate mutase/prephenate dehydratase
MCAAVQIRGARGKEATASISAHKFAGTPRVAFQGEVGAYSEQAVLLFFGPTASVEPCKSLREVFSIIEKGGVEFGVVPVENSSEGSVNETYDLLLDSSLKVSGEISLRVTHCLIANPDARLTDIKVVYSHPQALAQCRRFLQRLNCEVVSTYDTAGSVKMIRERGMVDSAAVASEKAAEVYAMKVLKKAIEDSPNNYTRFFVLSKGDAPPSGRDKTSIIFSVKHLPGTLFRALQEFAVRRINLTKIESRPTRQNPWEYNFYLDFEGHRKEAVCKEALEGLRKKSIFVKILGSYPRAS